MNEGLHAYRSGDYTRARAAFEHILQHDPKQVDARQFLGLVLSAQGDLAGAEHHLREALNLAPGHPALLNNLGLVLLKAGNAADAVACYEDVLKQRSDDVGALVNLSKALHHLGRNNEARGCLEKLTSLQPQDARFWFMLGQAEEALGDDSAARKAYQQTLKCDPAQVAAYKALGLIGLRSGDYATARASFERALEGSEGKDSASPEQLELRFHLGTALLSQNEHGKAIAEFEAIVEQRPKHAESWLNLGVARRLKRDYVAALEAFQHAIENAPDALDPQYNLALTLELCNRVDDAMREVDKALSMNPDHIGSKRVKATLLRRGGEPERATEMLNTCDISERPSDEQAVHYFELGQAYDKAKKYSDAYAAFERMNDLNRDRVRAEDIDKDQVFQHLEHELSIAKEHGLPEARGATKDFAPVFLAGFPRSGTTLLDQILSGHNNLTSMEEKPSLLKLYKRVFAAESTRQRPVANLDESVRRELAEFYKDDARRHCAVDSGKVVFDRHPMNGRFLRAASLVFPGAKVVFAQRHPCDVCLSCFMQNFAFNDTNACFLTMEDTVKAYDLMMQLWEVYKASLDVDIYTIRYEDLVEEPQAETRRLVEFIGLEWQEDLLDYVERVKAKGDVQTASYAQVAQPLYKSSRYRWENYRQWLEPHFAKLSPHVERFGYEALT